MWRTGVRGTQFTRPVIARVLGSMGVVCLAAEAIIDRTTLTRDLRLLQKRGMVHRFRSFVSLGPSDLLFSIRDDDHLQIRLANYFQ